ncbi:MAG: c-type cytochrome [Steroidobacteraceae bacterium]
MALRCVRVAWALMAMGAFGTAAMAADAARGEKLAYTCKGCHGIEDYKNTYPTYSVPKLKGQSATYLAIALKSYRDSERGHATMHSQAASMSDEDMADLAAYLGGEPVKAEQVTATGTPPQAAQLCVACHGNNGVGIVPEYPTLSGQHADYLARALHDYKNGTRKNPVMGGFMGQLTDENIAAVAEYYSRQAPGLSTTDRRKSFLSAK